MRHDVFFFSYDETYADENWKKVKNILPSAQRIQGIKGTVNAWKAAAENTKSTHFFSIDADNVIHTNFDWSKAEDIEKDDQRIHVWRCRNSINGLIYGHGALKLWPKDLVLKSKQMNAVDFTCESAIHGFVIRSQLASETVFNHTPFLTWKAAYRECAKLASNNAVYYNSQPDPITQKRLQVWTSLGADSKYGYDCIAGARMGALFGFENRQDNEAILLINNQKHLELHYQHYLDNKPDSELILKLQNFGIQSQNFSPEQSFFIKNNFNSI